MIDFSEITQDLKAIQSTELHEWDELIKKYPFFNAAYLFKAKKLKEDKHQDYDEFISVAAAYAPSRKRLYQIIHQDLNEKALEQEVQVSIVQEDIIHTNESEEKPAPEILDLDELDHIKIVPVVDSEIEIIDQNIVVSEVEDLKPNLENEQKQEDELPDRNTFESEVIDKNEADIVEKSLLEIIEESKIIDLENPKDLVVEEDPQNLLEPDVPSSDEKHFQADTENSAHIKDDILDKAYITMDYSTIIQAEDKKTQEELIQEKSQSEKSNVEGTQSTFVNWLKKYQSAKIEKLKPIEGFVTEPKIEAVKSENEKTEITQSESTKKTELLKEKLESNKESVILTEEENRQIIQEAAKSVQDDERIVSETLAFIYAEQGNISKAKRIFEQLILLFPEKSDTFADAIRNLKKK